MIKFFQKLKAKKGFTLVELIVVIAIIGVLAAILVPTMLGYVTSSRVTSADSTAASIKNNIDTFLTNADTAGYGMKLSDSSIATFEFNVTPNSGDPIWAVTVGAAAAFGEAAEGENAFKEKEGVGEWSAEGTTDGTDGKLSTNVPDKLCAELKALFPEIETAVIRAYVVGGKTMYLWYTADSSDVDEITGAPGADDFEGGSFEWNEDTAGVTTDGFILGTAPKLAIGAATGGADA